MQTSLAKQLSEAQTRLQRIAYGIQTEEDPDPTTAAASIEVATAINLQTEVIADYFDQFLDQWRELIMATRGEVSRR